VRTGQVWYSRSYEYNLDGSRRVVERNDMLHGAHRDVYAYDPVSGRLASVQDKLTGEVNDFAWNPEGTLARWGQPSSYARVFGYDMVCADSQGEIVNFHSIRLPEEVMGDFDPAALGQLRELICRFLPFLCKKKPNPNRNQILFTRVV
jgi:hypothetical protein